MSLANGHRLGAYEVISLIGAGGMGEVYRARDTRLQRDVAIKVLPDAFVHDAERLARFKREAHVLASLNHPNIAAIYGLEESASRSALVLELVVGSTLADRIASGPIPLHEALPIARQIAEALGAAHDHGIVHRDLKPANIKLTADGTVKVLDFGLAKATESSTVGRDFSRADISDSPTITSPAMTMGGVILGTAAYMSPEQAKGKSVDKRSDVWAFGCVLYEMLTGKRAFEGEDVSDTLAAILRGEPDWSLLPSEASGAVSTVLRRCLEKDRKRRVGDVSTVLFVLNEPALTTPLAATGAAPGARMKRSERLLWLAGVVAAIAATVAAAMYFRPATLVEPQRRLSIALPEGAGVSYVTVSPDGGRVAVTMRTAADNRPQIWIRSLDSEEFRPLPGTFNARTPFFSPDGRSIAFFADGKLKVIAAAGGPPQELCDSTGLGRGGTWSRKGEILIAAFGAPSSALRRVNASGGPCTDVLKPDLGSGVGFPVFLPDDEHFLYVGGGDPTKRGVFVASLREPSGRRLFTDFTSVMVAPPPAGSRHGHLLFLRETTLMAQPFDFASMELLGDPFTAAATARMTSSAPQVAAGISEDGTLVFLAGRPEIFRPVWLDRTTGKELQHVAPASDQRGIVLSADERTVLFSREQSVWMRDIARGVETSLGDRTRSPLWSPDGARILFSTFGVSAAASKLTIRDMASGKEDSIAMETPAPALSDWSRDGRVVMYTEINAKTQGDIWALTDPLSHEARKAVPFLVTNFNESQAQLSPDGRWVAYTSDEPGEHAVYVSAFPSAAGKRRVSPAEGREPRWRRDGGELYYLAGSSSGGGRHTVMAVPVTTTSTDISLGVPAALFEFQGRGTVPQGNMFQYAPGSEGGRFLVNVVVGDSEPALHVITNWQHAR